MEFNLTNQHTFQVAQIAARDSPDCTIVNNRIRMAEELDQPSPTTHIQR